MNTDITTFEGRVKEKLKGMVADLIPEDRWTAIVENTVKEFERVDLPKLVKEELTVTFKAMIREELEKPEWKAQWNATSSQMSSEAIKEIITEAAPKILANMISGAAQQALYNFQNGIR